MSTAEEEPVILVSSDEEVNDSAADAISSEEDVDSDDSDEPIANYVRRKNKSNQFIKYHKATVELERDNKFQSAVVKDPVELNRPRETETDLYYNLNSDPNGDYHLVPMTASYMNLIAQSMKVEDGFDYNDYELYESHLEQMTDNLRYRIFIYAGMNEEDVKHYAPVSAIYMSETTLKMEFNTDNVDDYIYVTTPARMKEGRQYDLKERSEHAVSDIDFMMRENITPFMTMWMTNTEKGKRVVNVNNSRGLLLPKDFLNTLNQTLKAIYDLADTKELCIPFFTDDNILFSEKTEGDLTVLVAEGIVTIGCLSPLDKLYPDLPELYPAQCIRYIVQEEDDEDYVLGHNDVLNCNPLYMCVDTLYDTFDQMYADCLKDDIDFETSDPSSTETIKEKMEALNKIERRNSNDAILSSLQTLLM